MKSLSVFPSLPPNVSYIGEVKAVIGEDLSHLAVNRSKKPKLPLGALNYPLGIHILQPVSNGLDPLLYVCDGNSQIVVFNAITGEPIRSVQNKAETFSFDFVHAHSTTVKNDVDAIVLFITNGVGQKVH